MARSRRLKLVAAAITGCCLAAGVLYAFILWEGSSTRADAPWLEQHMAQWLLHRTVPAKLRAAASPLGASPAATDIAAGQRLFQGKCEICHAHDGSGLTEIGAGQYPRPPDLRGAPVQSQSDGELYYHIANGIRHTGMPAWRLAERETWQLVAYLRHLPLTAATASSEERPASVEGASYVGSAACERCHSAIYTRWKATRMANVVRDPRTHPDAIIPDLTKPDPLVTFTRDDIAFVYGSRWKQRYFKRVGDDYFPLPAQWDITHEQWRPYFVKPGTDWWAKFYPADNLQRPTGPLCDGCHSVNYEVKTKTVTEWNVGCERCHGPGSLHIADPQRTNTINPARLDYVHGNDVCISCHSQGQPLSNPIEGRYFDWPVGYHVGKNLAQYWRLEDHKLGETTFTHFTDGTGHKNRMQGNDFVQSVMYTRGVTCFSCHDVHGTPNAGLLREPGNGICLTCHGPNGQNGPRTATLEAHTRHKAGSPGSQCAACHMPKIEQTIADVNVHAHTFKFITPSQALAMGIKDPCTGCHADKPEHWAAAELARWPERSPWRMAE